jgi:hypothetical protein
MQWDGPIVVFLLFLLRLALPLAVLLGLGYLYERYLAQKPGEHAADEVTDSEAAARATFMATQPGYAASRVPCWDFMGCSEEQRTACPVSQRPNVPCWLTRQLVQGQLPDECVGCQIYKDAAQSHAHPAA